MSCRRADRSYSYSMTKREADDLILQARILFLAKIRAPEISLLDCCDVYLRDSGWIGLSDQPEPIAGIPLRTCCQRCRRSAKTMKLFLGFHALSFFRQLCPGKPALATEGVPSRGLSSMMSYFFLEAAITSAGARSTLLTGSPAYRAIGPPKRHYRRTRHEEERGCIIGSNAWRSSSCIAPWHRLGPEPRPSLSRMGS